MLALAIDCGNTKLKIGLVNLESNEVISFQTTTFSALSAVVVELVHRAGVSALPLGVTTVVEETKERLTLFTEQCPHISEMHFCTALNTTALTFDYDRNLLGSDRVAAALAAHALFPNEDCIVVDSGTATKVDMVTDGGIFLGGYILPGIGTKAFALAAKTDKLPEGDVYNIHYDARPSTTLEAIETGLILDTIGGIERAISLAKKQLYRPTIIACGGGWEIIRPYWGENQIITIPELTLLGAGLTLK